MPEAKHKYRTAYIPERTTYRRDESNYRPLEEATAMDRYFRTPIFRAGLGANKQGQFVHYNLDNPEARVIADLNGSTQFIDINDNIPPGSDAWNSTLKHELVHALQKRLANKKQDLTVDVTSINPFSKGFWDNLNAAKHWKNLTPIYGTQEAEAYTLSDTIGENEDFRKVSIPQYENIIRKAMIQKLIDTGYAKEAKIWDRK